tara:strand:+ start:1850 stop:2206 length:357 start_codon:yes stop_codon:yes gene_type:complete
MKKAEQEFNVSVEFTNGTNSYWMPTPLEEITELDCFGIIDIGDDQSEFEKLISLIHEVGHVIYQIKNDKLIKFHSLFEESLAWYLGYDYAYANGIEIDLKEYAKRVELALKLYVKELE